MIGAAVAEAALLASRNVPPLELLKSDAEKLRREVERLLAHAVDLSDDFAGKDRSEPNFVDAQAWMLGARLYTVRVQLTLAHMELIPHADVARRAAAMRTAEYLRQKIPVEHRIPQRLAA